MSNRRVWWICELGHEWESNVYHRVEGNGCPYCCGQKPISGQTDLETLEPELAAQWHPTKNGHLRPSDVTLKSHKRVWWICEEGHEWQTRVFQRVGGNGCPVCSNHRVLSGYNDLLTVAPELAAQWHPVRNGGLEPSMVLPRHNSKVWWMCENGHEWQASPNNRMAGCGCPFCNQHRVIPGVNSLAMVKPEVAQQWEYGMNGKLMPDDISPFSNKKVWWSCEYGHKWKSTVASRSYGHGCPICWNHKQKSRRYFP